MNSMTQRILVSFTTALLLVPLATAIARAADALDENRLGPVKAAAKLKYDVSWVGNSFSGADDKWVQNFFIHMKTAADGSCFTWSHWDEGGRRFGVYRDGDIIANKDVKANSLKVKG